MRFVLVVVALLPPALAGATSPYLLGDIRSDGTGSWPKGFVELAGVGYFSATEVQSGRELWRSDGSRGGTRLVADVCPGRCSGDPMELVVWNGLLYFTADDGASGRKLWTSDGTQAGTRRVADVCPGTCSGVASPLVASGAKLYFAGLDAARADELWSSDGTSAGTQLAVEIRPGPTGAKIAALTSFGGRIWFRADGAAGSELWSSDGTPAGTQLYDLEPGALGSSPHELSVVGTTLYFAADLPRRASSPGRATALRAARPCSSISGRAAETPRPLGSWTWVGSRSSVRTPAVA